MTDELLTKLKKIKNEKQLHLRPEYIMKDVTILGVTGILDEGTIIRNDLKLFIQDTEPETFDGIWLNVSSLNYDYIVETTRTNLVANSINIIKGTRYETVLFNSDVTGGLHYKFRDIYVTDSNNDIDYAIPVAYGDGTQWIDITPSSAKVAGLACDFVNNTFTRLGDAITWSAGENFNQMGCYQRKRCNITDSGIVTAYYGDTNYTENGFTTAEFITEDGTIVPIGTEVQVMVEQPKVWYKVEPIQLASDGITIEKANYYITDQAADGYKVHPAFIRNGIEYDKLYVSAYEATLFDVSSKTYTGGTTTNPDYAVDKLASIKGSNLTPRVSLTRANFRKLANNRGTNWTQLNVQVQSLEQLLMTIEYATFNHQAILSKGNTSSNAAKAIGTVTNLNSSGTGLAGSSSTDANSFTWRYAENIYGDIWKWQDGMNLTNRAVYIADHDFVDDTFSGVYTNTGLTMVASNNYISRFGYKENYDWLFIPVAANGTANAPIGDYCYSTPTNRVSRVGGSWTDGAQAGSFYLRADYNSSSVDSNTGSRLCYMTTE